VKIVKAAHRPHNTWPDVTRRGPWSRFLIGGALIDWPCCLPQSFQGGRRQASPRFLASLPVLFVNSRLAVDP